MTKLLIDFIFLSTLAILRFIIVKDKPEERRKVLEEYKEDYYNTIKLYNHSND
jgi:hypothetical protein